MRFAIAVLILIALSVAAARERNGIWKNDAAFWAHTAELSPLKLRANNNAGIAYYEYGDAAKAIDYYLRALKISPYNVDVLYNKCMAHYVNGECSMAQEYCNLALLLDKDATDVRYTLRIIREKSCAKKDAARRITHTDYSTGKEGHEKLLKAFGSKRI